MATRWFARFAGAGYLALGMLGLIPVLHSAWPADAPDLATENAYGYLFGIFPKNLLLTLVHLAVGLWGTAAAHSFGSARTFARGVALLYGALALMGLVPKLNTVFGLMPLFGITIWLHAPVAVIAAGMGWAVPVAPETADRAGPTGARSGPGVGAPSAAMLGGVPVHALLAPFPIACLAGALVTDLAYWWTTLPWYDGSEAFWPEASRWLVGAGLVSGVLAALAGLVDFLAIQPARAHPAGWLHSLGSAALLMLALANLWLRLGEATAALPWGIILSAATAALLALSNWHGSALVYRHRIGVTGPIAAPQPTVPAEATRAIGEQRADLEIAERANVQ